VGEVFGRATGQLTRLGGSVVGRLGKRGIDVGGMGPMVGMVDWLTLSRAILAFRLNGRFSLSGVKFG